MKSCTCRPESHTGRKQTFRLYHHNPPLVKLVAALPVVWASPIMEPVYQQESWKDPDPSQTTFSQTFAFLNIAQYFELFRLARLAMPLFSIVGGLAVFAWSRRLYGTMGGLLSLTLWVFCPNILAHARLVTSDLGSTALGVAATYVFWRYCVSRVGGGPRRGGYARPRPVDQVHDALTLCRLAVPVARASRSRHSQGRAAVKYCAGTRAWHPDRVLEHRDNRRGLLLRRRGDSAGRLRIWIKVFNTAGDAGDEALRTVKTCILEATWQFRENRFRGTWLERIPCPLPEHYVLGFDEQKIETEGIPERYYRAVNISDEATRDRLVEQEREIPESVAETKEAYPVYLNGELRRTGWWYYYLLALAYKVPEGTWVLVILSLASLRFVHRSSADWADEIALWTVPLVILFSMTFSDGHQPRLALCAWRYSLICSLQPAN